MTPYQWKLAAIAAVDRGAALLDRLCPGWADRIDPARLDFRRPKTCLLGQLYGTYARGRTRLKSACWLHLNAQDCNHLHDHPEHYGLALDPAAIRDIAAQGFAFSKLVCNGYLTAAWTRHVRPRRAAGGAPRRSAHAHASA